MSMLGASAQDAEVCCVYSSAETVEQPSPLRGIAILGRGVWRICG